MLLDENEIYYEDNNNHKKKNKKNNKNNQKNEKEGENNGIIKINFAQCIYEEIMKYQMDNYLFL